MAWKATTQEAARRPPSTPGLIRRSGRIPALPYPPIKLLHCTAVAPISRNTNHPLWKKTAINPGGGLGGKAPQGTATRNAAFSPDSAGDSRRYKKQIAVCPTHVSAFKCLSRKEMFRMLHTYTADAPRISVGTKG